MSIGSTITFLKEKLPANIKLVAVSKFHSPEDILEAYRAGQRVFGENRAQELAAKQKVLPQDIEWHFIGPLQANKVKDMATFVHTVHSVDSLKLLREIEKQAGKHGRIINVLLEIHIAKEESKHGFTSRECKQLLGEEELNLFKHIRICGLMGMATFTENLEEVRQEFRLLRSLFEELKSTAFRDNPFFRELSMGMTGDYEVAIEEGSTMVRIGSFIFGAGRSFEQTSGK